MPRTSTTTFCKSQYDQDYIKRNIIRKQIQFNRLLAEDMELLTWAESKGNLNQYIKGLIRRDMGKQDAPTADPESRG